MNRIEIVTTTNAEGWAQTGRRMAESIVERWPTSCLPLTVYAEGFWPDMAGTLACRLPTWLGEFKDRHHKNPTAHGRVGNGYDFRWDAVKFAHKVAAVEAAAQSARADFLIWMDADTFTHAPVTEEWLERILPNPIQALAWPWRVGNYPECGFLIFNLRQHPARAVIHEWRRLYETDEVFNLPQTHDSFVLQVAVERIGASWKSLSGDAANKAHVIALGPLADRIDHRKGARKALPHSPEHRVLANAR